MYNSLGSWHPALCKHLCLEFARKPPLAQTWPHQIGSDWKIAPIKAVSFRGTGLHFWEAFSGCLQWLWGSAVLPCLRQNPKCLTTRHTILGHRGGSTPSPRQGRLCVCLIRYVAPPHQQRPVRHHTWPDVGWAMVHSVQSAWVGEKGGGISSWPP